MRPIRILVDSLADEGLLNAQMGNAREIIYRLDPDEFHISTFVIDKPDLRIASRKNTRLIQLPKRRQTPRILSEFLFGAHELLFYVKASPASKWYLNLRNRRDRRITVGTIESQCNLKDSADVSPRALSLWEKTILKCDRLYSNSTSVQASLNREYGLASEVIPTGADTHFFTPDWNRSRNSRLQVLFVGSLSVGKQPKMMVEAAACFPEADFRIVGEGRLRGHIEAEMVRQRLSNVVLTGPLAAERLRYEYRQADVFFFPSSFEGSPKVIVEAAACGVPVICRSSYSPETVLQGVTGFQADSDDELFGYLKLLVNNADLRARMGRAGRQHSHKFDWDPITKHWRQAFWGLARGEQRCAS